MWIYRQDMINYIFLEISLLLMVAVLKIGFIGNFVPTDQVIRLIFTLAANLENGLHINIACTFDLGIRWFHKLLK